MRSRRPVATCATRHGSPPTSVTPSTYRPPGIAASPDTYGQFPATTVPFNLRPGASLGAAAERVDQAILDLRVPPTVTTSFQGTVKEFRRSFQNLTVLLIVVIYIVLGILYESFIHPLTILSGLPSAVFGALLTLQLFGRQIDLYAFVGIIMLFGVVKKNAIMMIDFAIMARAVAVVGGLVVSQFLTLYITPVIYLYLDKIQSPLCRGGDRVAPSADR